MHALAAALAAGADPARLTAADAARAYDTMLELLAKLSGMRAGRLTGDDNPVSAVR